MRVEIARAINLRNIYGADYEMMMMMMIARTDIPDRVIGNNKMRTHYSLYQNFRNAYTYTRVYIQMPVRSGSSLDQLALYKVSQF